MTDTYRPFSLTAAQCHEVVDNRIKKLTEKVVHLEALGLSASSAYKGIVFLGWLKESLDSRDGNTGVLFTYRELEEFIGDAREP